MFLPASKPSPWVLPPCKVAWSGGPERILQPSPIVGTLHQFQLQTHYLDDVCTTCQVHAQAAHILDTCSCYVLLSGLPASNSCYDPCHLEWLTSCWLARPLRTAPMTGFCQPQAPQCIVHAHAPLCNGALPTQHAGHVQPSCAELLLAHHMRTAF